MPGNQNAGVCADAEIDFRNFRIAVAFRICLVEQCHAFDTELARFEDECREVIARKAVVEERSKPARRESVNGGVLVAERICMMDVGGKTFESVHEELAQTADILVFRSENADFLCFCRKIRDIRIVGSCRAESREPCRKRFVEGNRSLDAVGQNLAVEVRIRNRGKEIVRDAVRRCGVNCLSRRAHLVRDLAKSLCHIEQKILQCRNLRFLSTDTDLRAALAARRLLALEAKHLVFHKKLSFIDIHSYIARFCVYPIKRKAFLRYHLLQRHARSVRRILRSRLQLFCSSRVHGA